MDWCFEPNKAEMADSADDATAYAYLDPVYMVVGSMKFVPISNSVKNMAVKSSWKNYYFSMPLIKIINSKQDDIGGEHVYTVFARYPSLIYVHCSQNDEEGGYMQTMMYTGMLGGAWAVGAGADMYDNMRSEYGYFNKGSQFVADFEDCDGHFFSERDLHGVMLWFSDALRSSVDDVGGHSDFLVARDGMNTGEVASTAALCWMSETGYVPSYASAVCKMGDGGCTGEWTPISVLPCSMTGSSYIPNLFMNLYSTEEWKWLESMDEVHIDSSAMYELESQAHEVLTGTNFASCKDSPYDLGVDFDGGDSYSLFSSFVNFVNMGSSTFEGYYGVSVTCDTADFCDEGEGDEKKCMEGANEIPTSILNFPQM